jgi:hypothetical protein
MTNPRANNGPSTSPGSERSKKGSICAEPRALQLHPRRPHHPLSRPSPRSRGRQAITVGNSGLSKRAALDSALAARRIQPGAPTAHGRRTVSKTGLGRPPHSRRARSRLRCRATFLEGRLVTMVLSEGDNNGMAAVSKPVGKHPSLMPAAPLFAPHQPHRPLPRLVWSQARHSPGHNPGHNPGGLGAEARHSEICRMPP